MTLQPTREEWIWARDRIAQRLPSTGPDRLAEAALGPCPPEPAPSWKWRDEVDVEPLVSVTVDMGRAHGVGAGVSLVIGGVPYAFLPKEAEAFGRALIECAQWLREHGGQS